jgi:hypothetical protein
MIKPLLERDHPSGLGGIQKIYKFDNGYGASVIKCPFSYGSKSDLWELAVVLFDGDAPLNYKINYQTPITDDVLGSLTDLDVEDILVKIGSLDKQEKAA